MQMIAMVMYERKVDVRNSAAMSGGGVTVEKEGVR